MRIWRCGALSSISNKIVDQKVGTCQRSVFVTMCSDDGLINKKERKTHEFDFSFRTVSQIRRQASELDRGRAQGAGSRRCGGRGGRGQRTDRVRGGRRKSAAQHLLHFKRHQDTGTVADSQSFRGKRIVAFCSQKILICVFDNIWVKRAQLSNEATFMKIT